MYGLKRVFYFPVAIALLLSSSYVSANVYLEQLVDRANELKLHQDSYWLKLVHYKPAMFGGYRSEVLTREFFNSPEGNTDPKAELEATLAAFFSDHEETDKQQNPQCRFIARYHWLDSQLHFDPQQLKPRPCRRFHDWYNTIKPHQLTMIFPAGTDNSPSSMFGHTLIRVDRKDQTERTRLFSYSINYAADTDETNGLIFAYKGIFGGYPGRFAIMPYYEKVNQYNQMENRDIWEYQLNFNKQEIDRLLMHAWEVGQVNFAYYFFLENCSYRLLELFDIARPEMVSASEFDWFAIPGDTVHVALQEKGILKRAIYRPSHRTRIKHVLKQFSEQERRLVLELADGSLLPDTPALLDLPESRRATVYETAYDYVQYRHNRGAPDRDKIARTSYQLLRARSELDQKPEMEPAPIPEIRLDQGHGSSRIALGYVNDDHRDIVELRMRPAYHDLLDPREGYTEGAQINFFDLSLRHDFDREKTRIHAFRLIDIVSLVGRDEFFKPISWKFNIGFERWPIDDHPEQRMVFALNAGGGMTFSLSDSFKLFGLVDVTALGHEQFDDNLAGGIGPNLGAIWDVSDNWRVWANSRVQRFGNHLDLTYVEHTVAQSFHWNRDSSIRLEWQRRGPEHRTTDSVSLSWHWYLK